MNIYKKYKEEDNIYEFKLIRLTRILMILFFITAFFLILFGFLGFEGIFINIALILMTIFGSIIGLVLYGMLIEKNIEEDKKEKNS